MYVSVCVYDSTHIKHVCVYAMQCNTVHCNVMLCYAILCYAMIRYVMLGFVMLYM